MQDEASCGPLTPIFILEHLYLSNGPLDEVIIAAAYISVLPEGALTTTHGKRVTAGVFFVSEFGIAPFLEEACAPETRLQFGQSAPRFVQDLLLNVEGERIFPSIVQVVLRNISSERPFKVIHHLGYFQPVCIKG